MKRRKLLERLTRGHVKNMPFQDFVDLVVGFGFNEVSVRGSHHAFGRSEVQQLMNLQPQRGEAKPYQIRQFLRLVESYNLRLEEED